MMIDRRRVVALLGASLFAGRASTEPLALAALPGNVEAPAFALPDLSGTVRHLSEFRGRPVLVNFWAVWCPPCRRELGELATLRKNLAGTSFEILAINLGDSAERISSFLANHPAPDLPILLDIGKTTLASWHVADSGLPVAYALDRSGILRLGAIGERDWRSPAIERQLRELIAG
jgi:thiol-disulfide isomerase/thioredoxin